MEPLREGRAETLFLRALFGKEYGGHWPFIVLSDGSTCGLDETICEILATLPASGNPARGEKQKNALVLRFGLLTGIYRTYEEVGQELGGFTREWARQLVKNALRRLRHPSRSNRLRPFLVNRRR